MDYERIQKLANTSVVLLWSFFISLGGGLTLVWWELEYHSTNRQQWMVPFGLIMLVTPVIVCFSLFVSDICNSSAGQLSASLDDSVHHPVWLKKFPCGQLDAIVNQRNKKACYWFNDSTNELCAFVICEVWFWESSFSFSELNWNTAQSDIKLLKAALWGWVSTWAALMPLFYDEL